jgi:hypothetical protein
VPADLMVGVFKKKAEVGRVFENKMLDKALAGE